MPAQRQIEHEPMIEAFRSYRGDTTPRFRNEDERACALVLDRHGVPWEYRPVTFELAADDDAPADTFCPAFYLPEQNLFLEVGSLREEMAATTNHKVRRLRRQYPDVHVRRLVRRDVEELGRRLVGRGSTAFIVEPASVLDEAAALVMEA